MASGKTTNAGERDETVQGIAMHAAQLVKGGATSEAVTASMAQVLTARFVVAALQSAGTGAGEGLSPDQVHELHLKAAKHIRAVYQLVKQDLAAVSKGGGDAKTH